nr:hypothetical transcript [Hymenolepis microstoma]
MGHSKSSSHRGLDCPTIGPVIFINLQARLLPHHTYTDSKIGLSLQSESLSRSQCLGPKYSSLFEKRHEIQVSEEGQKDDNECMSEFKPNSRDFREVLHFYINMKKSADWLRLTGLSQILMVKWLLVTERVGNGSNVLSGDFVVEDRHSGGGENVAEDVEVSNSRRTIRIIGYQ